MVVVLRFQSLSWRTGGTSRLKVELSSLLEIVAAEEVERKREGPTMPFVTTYQLLQTELNWMYLSIDVNGMRDCKLKMANLLSESQRIQYTIKTKTEDIPDARTYLLTLKEIRVKRGLTDELDVETMMMDALEKVEKELKKPLLRSDKKGMALLTAEFDKINKKEEFQDEKMADVKSLDLRNFI
ncbi:hypothetical protein GIB67_028575 [Kingdonia uniflora]|uniref:Uncharacterized protein n=1 Tax=Kingdonia uniflora TaxID=39325 RepID=A0A7J7NVM2_9MAGN|nr:hypothetical protein GIB67_028575 [Kingdonia uniflora]